MTQVVVSPCVGLCSTTVGDNVCRGCQRHDQEILRWFSLDGDERERRIGELDALRIEVAANFVEVIDEDLLERQMRRHRVRFRSAQPAASRVIELLRVGRDRIGDLAAYGIALRPGVPGQPQQLYAAISQALQQAGEERRTLYLESGPDGAQQWKPLS